MQNKVFNYYKDLPSWAKGVVVVGGLAIVGIAVYSVIKKLKTDAEIKKILKESEYANDQLKKLASQGIFPTLSNTQIQSMIESIRDAVAGCGTDEQRIYDVFSKLNNEADLNLLIKLFGVQSYEPCPLESQISYIKWLADNSSIGGSITQILTSELNNSELSKLNSILANKGINHKF
jgi:hypothetical protein